MNKAYSTRWYHLFAHGFGSGLLPKAPGTWGSIAAAIVWWFAIQPLPLWLATIVVAIAFAIAPWICATSSLDWGQKDHPRVVWDEWVGVWIALLPLQQHFNLALFIFGIILFRVLDITKPPPVRYFDNIDSGWGILLDDVVAGMLSAGAIVLLVNAR